MSLYEVLFPRRNAKVPALSHGGTAFPVATSVMQGQPEPPVLEGEVGSGPVPPKPQRPTLDSYVMPRRPVAPTPPDPNDPVAKRNRQLAIAERIGQFAGSLANLASLRRGPQVSVQPQQAPFGQRAAEYLNNQQLGYQEAMKQFGRDIADYDKVTRELHNKQVDARNDVAVKDYERDADEWYRRLSAEQKAVVDWNLAQQNHQNQMIRSDRQNEFTAWRDGQGYLYDLGLVNARAAADKAAADPANLSNLFGEVYDAENELIKLDRDLRERPFTPPKDGDIPYAIRDDANALRRLDPRQVRRDELVARLNESTKGFNPTIRNQYLGYRTQAEEHSRQQRRDGFMQNGMEATSTALESYAAALKNLAQKRAAANPEGRREIDKQAHGIHQQVLRIRQELSDMGFDEAEIKELIDDIIRK